MGGIKLLALDLDDTLLRSDKTVSDYSVNILRRCLEKGVAVAFATARAERACERFSARFSPEIMVTNGGALAKIGGEIIYRAVLDAGTSDALITACARHPDAGYITVETDEGYFVNHPTDPAHGSWIDYRHAVPFDFSRGTPGLEAYKLTVQFPRAEIAREIAQSFRQVELTAFSGENWFRFAHRDATKWRGVEAVARRLGLDTKKIAAFGDDFSDICMVENCGFGVAMANAIDEVKAAAKYICESNDEDGAARWIAGHVLGGAGK